MAGAGSAIGTVSNSPEYEAIKDCVPRLRLAVQGDLVSVSGELLSVRLISDDKEEFMRNRNHGEKDRAAELVSLVMNKVREDSKNYCVFLEVLRKDPTRYESILNELEKKCDMHKTGRASGKPLTCSQDYGLEDPTDVPLVKSKLGNTAVSVASQTTLAVSNGQQHQPHLAFGAVCGCTICSSDLGCPKPITAETIFPLLEHMGGLDKLQKEDLRMRLKRETKEIMMVFYRLLSHFFESLKDRHVTVDDLKTHLMVIEAFDEDDQHQSVFLEQSNKLENAKTVNDVFGIIKVFCSFFNYELIEYMIDCVGSDEDKAHFEDYQSKFAEYARRRIYECPPKTAMCTAEQSTMYIKLESRYSKKLSLNDLREFRFNISKLLKVSQYAIRLCCIEKGCIRLTFQFPNFVKQRLFPLTSDQESSLLEMGVTHVACGDYEFPNEVKQEKPSMNIESNTDQADSRENGMSCLDCKTGVGGIPLLCKTHSVCQDCIRNRTGTIESSDQLLLCNICPIQNQVEHSYTYRDAVLSQPQTHGETQVGECTQEQLTSSHVASKPIRGVWMFVNDSNIWIEAKKLQSRQKGYKAGEDHRVRMDMGKLADVLAQGRPIERGVLYGSEPPQIDTVWEKIREKGWDTCISQRIQGKEKKITTRIVVDIVQLAETTPMEKRSSIIIVSGDASIVPAIEKVVTLEGWTVEVYMWSRATSNQLIKLQSKHKERLSVSSLDPYLDKVVFTNMKFSYSNKNFIEKVKKTSVVFTVNHDPNVFPGHVPTEQWMSKLAEIAQWPCQYCWYNHPSSGRTNKLVVVFQEDSKAGPFDVKKFIQKVTSGTNPIPCVIRIQSFHEFTLSDQLERNGGDFEQFGIISQDDAQLDFFSDSVYVASNTSNYHITKWDTGLIKCR